MNKNYFFIYFFASIYFGIIRAVTINLAGQSFLKSFEELYALITREFNNYAQEEGLDIHLNFILFSIENTTKEWDSFDSAMHLLLQQKKTKYDMFIYDPLYTRRYSPHLVNLKSVLPEDHLKMYSGDAEKIGAYKDKWVGLPLLLKYTVLYSNINFLNKYKREIPKTWDELLDTAKYIMEKEREIGNENLIGYNGYFPKGESSMCSAYSFLYSYRDSKESPVPDINSEIAENAFNKLLELKTELSNDEIFKIEEDYNIIMLYSETVIFSNFWDFEHNVPNYNMTKLPGKTDDVNGSIIGGYLLGINNYISNEKKLAAAEVVKFLTSEYVQKEIILKQFRNFSGLFKLYDDEEVCSYTDCEMIKSIQGIERPSSLIDNYEDYSSKYTNLLAEFLFDHKPIKEVLSEIEDITRIYFYSMKSSTIELLFFVAFQILFYLILISIILLFIPSFKKHIKFLSNDLWFMFHIGIICMIISGLTKYGVVNNTKCYLNHAFMTLGLDFVLTPILYVLIINIPKINNFSKWVKDKKYLFIVLISGINILLNLLLLFSPNVVEDKIMDDSKNYSICAISNNFGVFIRMVQIIIELIKYLAIVVLIYLDWNMKTIYSDVRALILMMGMDGIIFVVFTISKIVNIENYILYHTLYLGIILVFSITNHGYLFVLRIIISMFGGSNENSGYMDKVRCSGKTLPKTSDNNTYQGTISKTSQVSAHESEISSQRNSGLFNNILKIHNSTSNY